MFPVYASKRPHLQFPIKKSARKNDTQKKESIKNEVLPNGEVLTLQSAWKMKIPIHRHKSRITNFFVERWFPIQNTMRFMNCKIYETYESNECSIWSHKDRLIEFPKRLTQKTHNSIDELRGPILTNILYLGLQVCMYHHTYVR